MNFPLFLADDSQQAAGVLLGLGAFGLALVLLTSLFWIWMLIDALRNPRLEPPVRLVWALVIFFLHFLGAIVYFFAGRSRSPTV